MEEEARIQASLSSDLLSSMYKNKVPQQIEEKVGDYKKYRFKNCDKPSYLIGKIKQINDSDKPGIEKDEIMHYFMEVDCDLLFVSVF